MWSMSKATREMLKMQTKPKYPYNFIQPELYATITFILSAITIKRLQTESLPIQVHDARVASVIIKPESHHDIPVTR